MNGNPPSHRTRALWAGVTAAALVAGVVLFVTEVTPWIAPLAVLVSIALAVGQRTSWPFAVAAGVIVELALVALVLRFTPELGVGLVGGAGLMFGLLGAAALIAFVGLGARRVVGRRELRVVAPLLIAPVLLVAGVAVTGVFSGNIEWAMHNDAVWNLVTTRMLIADGGLDAVAHPNPSPLTPGLLAIAAAVGRDVVAPGDLLHHDVGRFAAFWLIATSVAGLLAALIGARSVHGGSRTARVVAAAIAGVVPFTWFMFGFATQFGFYNATLTLMLLLATWLAWLETRVAPFIGAAVLSLAAVALLATWAPVAVLPFGLAVCALVSHLRRITRGRLDLRSIALLVLAGLPVPIYLLAVTLPDLRRDGAALAVDGGIMPLQPIHVAVIATVTLTASALTALHLHQRHQLVGVVMIVASAACVGGYLVYQRAATASPWGYYPAKFAWLVGSLLIVILTATLLSELAVLRGRVWASVGVVGLAVLLPGVMMAQVPPASDRLASVLTPVAIVTQRGVAAGEPAATRLFELAEPGVRTLALSYLTPAGDTFLNSWLLQLESTEASDPIRSYSYILDPRNEEQACGAVRAWAAPVRVVTSDPTLPERFARICADQDVTVDVLAP